MSAASRWLLGISCVLMAYGCLYTWWFWGRVGLILVPGVFCLIIAVTCIPGRHVAITSRIIAGVVFVLCVGYFIEQLVTPQPPILQQTSRSQPNLKNAILAFISFGLPSGYVMIFGIYPKWARFAGKQLGKDRK